MVNTSSYRHEDEVARRQQWQPLAVVTVVYIGGGEDTPQQSADVLFAPGGGRANGTPPLLSAFHAVDEHPKALIATASLY